MADGETLALPRGHAARSVALKPSGRPASRFRLGRAPITKTDLFADVLKNLLPDARECANCIVSHGLLGESRWKPALQWAISWVKSRLGISTPCRSCGVLKPAPDSLAIQ
jgi:hypothetical protein